MLATLINKQKINIKIMKKTILFSAFILSNLFFAQEFKLTAENFKENSNPEKNFYVLEIPGKTQSELFKKAKIYITGKYKGVKNDGYNEVEPEQIVLDVNGSNEKTIIINFSGANVWSVSNRYELNFKDGKVMIKPIFRELTNTIERNSTVQISSLFNKKGEPRKEKAISFVDSETNTFVTDFIKGMQGETSSDW